MIRNFNTQVLKWIFIVALIPTAINLLMTLAPHHLALLLIGLILFWRPARQAVLAAGKALIKGAGKLAWEGTKLTVKGIYATGKFLINGPDRSEARFMTPIRRWLWLDGGQNGYLIDGRSTRLPLPVTYQGTILQGGMGTGKSSRFIIPNLLKPPSNKPSFVISDTSGELYEKTSGYLLEQGYQIRTFNLLDVRASQTYNPLIVCQTQTEVAELAKVLVHASTAHQTYAGSDPFWNQAAEKLIRVLAQCLLNQPDDQFKNLANLRHLVVSFDTHTAAAGQLSKIDQFVLNATQQDLQTYNAYKALVGGNPKTLQSILMSADVALDPLAAPEIGQLTATGNLNFRELRQHPTALYLMVNQTQIPLYRFLLNLIYTQLFSALLIDAHNPGHPVWMLLDEFGHFQVKGFEVIATTARKYHVALHLALQSALQLEQQYGTHGAKIIRDGLGTQIFLPGLGLDDARAVSGRLGHQNGKALMTADRIIRLEDDEALILPGHEDPLRLWTREYFKNGELRWRASLPPAPLPSLAAGHTPLIHL